MLFRISSLRKSSVLNLAERGKNLNILRAILGYEIQSVYDFCELSTRISYLRLFRNDYKPQKTFKDLPTSAWERNEVLLAFKSTVARLLYVGKSKPTANDISGLKQTREVVKSIYLKCCVWMGNIILQQPADSRFLLRRKVRSGDTSFFLFTHGGKGETSCITASNPLTFARECSCLGGGGNG